MAFYFLSFVSAKNVFSLQDTREHAEKAKAALDGVQKKGRTLRVRFATHGAALKVKYLPSHVSNELLEEAFTQFGDVERAVVIVDDRGKSTGEGIVEFARKTRCTGSNQTNLQWLLHYGKVSSHVLL